MISILLVSHMNVARETASVVKYLCGESSPVDYFCIQSVDSLDTCRRGLEQKLRSLLALGDVIAVSDLLPGTPANLLLELSEQYDFEHITCSNLPLVLDLLHLSSLGLSVMDVCDRALETAHAVMMDAKELKRRLSDGNMSDARG